MFNFSQLEEEIQSKYSSEIKEIVEIYCEYRSLDKKIFEETKLGIRNKVLELSEACKLQDLDSSLKNIFIYLNAQIELHREIDNYFSHFDYWSWKNWCPDVPSESEKISSWDEIKKYISLDWIKLNSNHSYPHPTWTQCIELNEDEVKNDYYNNRFRSDKRKPTKKIIELQNYIDLWTNAKLAKEVVLKHISQVDLIKMLTLKLKVMDSMQTDENFFLFLFRSIHDRESLLNSINQVLGKY